MSAALPGRGVEEGESVLASHGRDTSWSAPAEPTAGPPGSDVAPPPRFVEECRAFFARRISGPEEARAAVLEALDRGAPYLLAWSLASAPAPSSRAARIRAGLLAEVGRAAFQTCLDAHRGPRPASRLGRARQVLAADTLLTFAWELAADLPGKAGARVRSRLGLITRDGFLERLAAGEVVADPEEWARRLRDELAVALAEEG